MLGNVTRRMLRYGAAGLAAMALWTAGAGQARAQVGSSFYYENPRTGFSYSHDYFVGRGRYYQSFGYRAPYGGYSSRYYYDRAPRYGNRHYGYGSYRRRCW